MGIGVYSALYVSVFGGFYTCAVHGMDITKLFSMVGLERYADKVDPTAGNLLVCVCVCAFAWRITGACLRFMGESGFEFDWVLHPLLACARLLWSLLRMTAGACVHPYGRVQH